MDELHKRLHKFASEQSVDLFGVADLTPARDFIRIQGGEYIGQFPRAISIGMRLLDAIVDELYRHEDLSAVHTYRGLYNSVNANLDRVALLISERIQQAGYKAYPIPASQMISTRKLEGVISHKLAAHLAGLGWIGKSCLLVTPEYGPRVRWATILIDAPMATGVSVPNRCGSCSECVDICPPKAFTGVPFDPSEPRDVRFRAHLCNEYHDKRNKRLGEGICGLCVHICPHGHPKH
ncbi:MAG: 4Fe-4S double cluster binding domain-containing protein [Candidatus Hodarchaeota archaeon]